MPPKNRLKIFFIWTAIILMVLVMAGLYIAYKYADKIEKIVILEINKNFNRPILIKDVEFSLLSKFPKASVKITDVVVQGLKKEDEAFIVAKSIYFSFDFLSLFSEEISIKQIDIEEGQINVLVNKKGEVNYDILIRNKNDQASESILNIEEINLVHVALKYENVQQKQLYKLYSEDTELSLNMGNEQQFIVADFEGKINQVKIPGYQFKNSVLSEGNLELIVDKDKVDYLFNHGKINEQAIFVKGMFNRKKQSNKLHFTLSEANLDKILIFLPQNEDKTWKSYKIQGEINLKGDLNTSSSGISSITCSFSCLNGQFNLNDNTALKDISCKGTYLQANLSNLNKANIHLQNFSFLLNGNELQGKAVVHNLNTLLVDAELSGEIDIAYLAALLENDKIQTPTGTIHLSTSIKGQLMGLFQSKNLEALQQLQTKGDIEIVDFAFGIKDQKNTYQNISGKINFDNQNIQLQNFKGQINSTEFLLDGRINNYLSSLINKQVLDISASVKAGKFKLEEFINDENNSTKNVAAYNFQLPKQLKLDLSLELESFAFRKFTASEIKGKVHLENQILNFENLDFSSSEGAVNLKGKIASALANKIMYEGSLNLKGVNLKQLFSEMENFGQGFLLAKHLKGNLDTDVYFFAESDSALNIREDKIYCKAAIKIKNGELNQFEPLIDLQKFLKSEFTISLDLADLKFNTLENTIEIVKQIIYIPEMKISSNKINLEVSGTHGFNQEINYLFKVKNNEIFKAKNNNQIDQKYGVVENNDRTATLPILMSGTVDNPKFSYDLKTKKVIIKENLQQEKKEIKNAFKQELQEIMGKKDSVPAKKENKTTFKVEWEE